MSTPTTLATLPPPHHHHFGRHQAYQPSAASLAGLTGALANGSSARASASTNTYHTYSNSGSSGSDQHRRSTALNPRTANPVSSAHRDSPQMNSRSRRERGPDWSDFYRNGIPKEIIVIDDDDTPDSSHTLQNDSLMERHKDKKRKTGASSAYDPVYNPQPSYSTTQTPYYENSSANHTTSTDRTAPVYKASGSSSIGPPLTNGTYYTAMDDTSVGQKRKRAARVVDENRTAKRREVERDQSPYSAYVPPQQPTIKAKDVYVECIKETSLPKEKYDDNDGHYLVEPEAGLTDRYKIVKLLGQGTFGKVVEAWDRRKRSRCAIKIIRSVQKYRDASRIELRVLSTLASNDRNNRNKCIHLRHCFDFRNHICIVTDLYGQSVFDFLKGNGFTPFPSSHIQLFARQLLTSVAFLHDLNLIHTDLKPENILLVDNTYQTFTYNRTIPSSSTTTNRTARHRKVLLNPEIRLIDFGSATFNDEYHSTVVSTRHYRAPEIILNLGWSFACDMWSVGCILVEFFTGDALFQTHDNLEHLAMMEPVCNAKLDKELINKVFAKDRTSKNPAASYFTKTKRLDYPNHDTPRNSRKYVKAMKKLQEIIPASTDFNRQFLDLLKRIFVYDPAKRITAKEALQHQWFKEKSTDDGTEAARIREEKKKAARSEQVRPVSTY